ncbi:helix-turn-helix domain-containing protein [Streptomyces sp. NPDC002467]|uniref:helix-turn-helix domain-containing protein n=1 Tax=Streptomyces sp. NPDC002467 TaxID=3364647 RepID=UPI00368CC2C5
MTQSVDTTSASDAERSLPSPKERRRLREAAELTHDEVAAAVGVTPTTVRSWETGRTAPRGRKLELYARFLTRLQTPAEATSARASGAPDADAGSSDTPTPALHPSPEAARPFTGAGTHPEATADRTAAHPNGPAPTPTPAEAPSPDPTRHAPAAPTGAEATGAETPTPTPAPQAAGAPAGTQAPGAVGTPEPPPAEAPQGDAAAAPGSGPAGASEASPAEAPQETAEPDHPPAAAEAPSPDPAGTPPAAAETEPPSDPPSDPHPVGQRMPVDDFDALHAHAAAALTRQAYLLTGRRGLALEAVDRAFQQAWDRWPEVATDPDPVGWVRAAAYEYALSPWHRFRRAHRHPDKPPAEPADRILLDAMLALPTNHRRTVLLYDGVGLDLPDTAAETESSTPTAGNRLLHAHATLAARIPALAAAAPEKQSALLRDRFTALQPAVVLEPRPAAAARKHAERRARRRTRAVIGLAAVITVATAYTTATAPTKYEPPNAPGANVSGVPPHSGPQQLTEESKALHDKLRADPAAGPARIAPKIE